MFQRIPKQRVSSWAESGGPLITKAPFYAGWQSFWECVSYLQAAAKCTCTWGVAQELSGEHGA